MKQHDLSLITVFGLGHMRPAPGTWGSLPPVLLATGMYLSAYFSKLAPTQPFAAWDTSLWWVYHAALALMFVVFSVACIAQGDLAEALFGRKDPSEVVADETAGQCLPLMFLPAQCLASPALAAFTFLFAFVSFRLLDIVKPWPARGLQRVPGGWGVLLDDLFAGFYAMIIVQVTCRLTIAGG